MSRDPKRRLWWEDVSDKDERLVDNKVLNSQPEDMVRGSC